MCTSLDRLLELAGVRVASQDSLGSALLRE
jgi:hypothetical protein